jgi:putative sigma-54 modulation protein
MATEITGRNYDITPDIRSLIETKLTRIEDKLFDDVIDVRCVLQVEKYRNICEILVKGKDHDVKTVQESDESMQDAINAAMDHLKRQAQKNREKLRDHHRKDGNNAKSSPDITEWSVQVLEPGNLRDSGNDNRPRIIKTNNLPIRPMSIEEAALRLEDSKNEFIVFRDLDSDKIAVMYKRRDENLGLISPEV